jgi:hypothetical protein
MEQLAGLRRIHYHAAGQILELVAGEPASLVLGRGGQETAQ